MRRNYAAWRNGKITGVSVAELTLHERGPERCLIWSDGDSQLLRLDTEGRLHAFGHVSDPLEIGVKYTVRAATDGISVREAE